jgi:hypothetical protein
MNVLRKIFGPVKDNGVWMIRNNYELVERYGAPTRYYLSIYKNKIMMVKTYGKTSQKKEM